jgi:hypothetical protein
MNDVWWLAQGVGLGALLVNCGAFLFKSRQAIIGLQILSSGIWAFHFGLLDAQTAVAMNLLGMVRQGVFFFRVRHGWAASRWWPVGFCFAFLVGGFLSWQSLSSLLPIAAMLIGTIAVWQIETWKLRLLCMIPPPLWFSYNFLYGSLAGMLAEGIILSVQAVGYLMHERKGRFQSKRSPRNG